jgi:4-hydroxythreonine-4-phosphate dehydrogenase
MSKIKVVVTTGDIDGIGLEVAAKALHTLGPQKNVQIILFRSENADSRYFKLLDKKWSRITVDSLEEALKIDGPYLVDIESDLSPAAWVELTAKACMKKQVDAIATAPLSKTSIKTAGFKDLGHTDILKRISKAKNVNMGFVGDEFNVVLATGHLSIKDVSKNLSLKILASALWNADQLRRKLDKQHAKKPIAVLGLNPHSGEEGMIGSEELKLFPQLKVFAKANKIPMEGPLVPDAAFFKSNWQKYSLYLTLYHDQGLIPFKMIHGQDSGVHLTLGIPFVRTSVDHGTAKDIFGKNIANPSSMLDSIRWAIKLTRL